MMMQTIATNPENEQFTFVQSQTQLVTAPMVQPLTLQQLVQSQTLVPSLDMTQAFVLPQWTPQLPSNLILPQVPVSTAIQMYNEISMTLEPLPDHLRLIDTMTGMVVPLPGWSFITQETYQSLTPATSLSSEAPEVVAAVPEETISRSPTPEPVKEETQTPEEPVAQPENKAKKYPHRSKQILIEEVHSEVKEVYERKGLYASDDEVLRGYDTVRVHVKTYDGLKRIQEALTEVEEHPEIDLFRIATPISMKNKFQKKGFICYIKVEDPAQVPAVQSIFARYPEYKKCDVALPKEEPKPEPVVEEEPKCFFDFDDLDDIVFAPPRMIPKGSNASLAA